METIYSEGKDYEGRLTSAIKLETDEKGSTITVSQYKDGEWYTLIKDAKLVKSEAAK